MTPRAPSVATVLSTLPKHRLVDLARAWGLPLSSRANREEQLERLTTAQAVQLQAVLEQLGRDELKEACRAHGLDDTGRARTELATRLLQAALAQDAAASHGFGSGPRKTGDALPAVGEVVQARHRQYLVERVEAKEGQVTRVDMVCLDDDDQGRPLSLLWELELGARVLAREGQGLGKAERLDEPRAFAAYLHALKWNCVTATDAGLFQAPFRAGIRLMNHQLTPLKKALELPRVNLFIADDVGLGKTIEAGLVLQELILRQRAEWVLVVCPASVSLQWRDEMQRRFGVAFELFNRNFVARRRQERGFAVNPWSTHNHFIISYQTLRRPEYYEPLISLLGARAKKSLLIMDEAHTAAPSSASKYAVDSRITKVVQNLAPRFENRLFLSATPHNGHSNSFSSLLEILDPQRFTRGVKVNPRALEPVMVRRLKSDIRALGDAADRYPERQVLQVALSHAEGGWVARTYSDGKPLAEARVGQAEPVELRLSEMLTEYTRLMKPTRPRGKLVYINLQKRLLSSLEAFHRTLRMHAKSLGQGGADGEARGEDWGDDEYGIDEETQLELADLEASRESRALAAPQGRAQELLQQMLELSDAHRQLPDAKVLALLEWIRAHQCPGVKLGNEAPIRSREGRWNDRRVIIFTEYADTKRYLLQLLSSAVEPTDEGGERIMQLHGGMSDEARAEVQRAFNGAPADYPVRILVATDAAREGINLQGHCADLFHFDVPWNPARMEQRNGRIDRTLQPEPVVRCAYFVYPQRPEDQVLATLVEKVARIQQDLGSLSMVVMDRLSEALEEGIDAATAGRLDTAEQVPGRETVKAELEAQRASSRLRLEVEAAARQLNASRKVMDFHEELLRDALDVGCELAGAQKLERSAGSKDGNRPVEAYRLPELPPSWAPTLDSLRPPREREESFWDWRKREPLPVVFEPPQNLDSGLNHLHLQHPFVQRVLSRFLAQGYSAHDLARVTAVRTKRDALTRVLAFGRLSLFGPGAVRLHDELLSVAALWKEGGTLKPFGEKADRDAIEHLEEVLKESPDLAGLSEAARKKLIAAAPGDFAQLWAHLQSEATTRAAEAGRKLLERATTESAALRQILLDQKEAIANELDRKQMEFKFAEGEADQKRQFEEDRKWMNGRLKDIDREIETEPKEIAAGYRVVFTRLEPVGLIYLWPSTR